MNMVVETVESFKLEME